MACQVVNKRTHQFDVYIGRGSRWGNPFIIGRNGDRATVIALYADHLWHAVQQNPALIDELKALDGKTLGCFCKPLPCHGDVIANAVNWALKQPATGRTPTNLLDGV